MNILKIMFKNDYSILAKIFLILTFIILGITSAFSEVNSKNWQKNCNEENKNNCNIAIVNQIKLKDSEQMQTIATAYIEIGLTKQKKMNLVNKDEQTYKLGEETSKIPILFIDLPLNVDLRKKPLVKVDDIENISNLKFLYCNNNTGCKTMVILSDDVIEYFKKGKNLNVFFQVFGNNQNIVVQFPLKGFTKSFDDLKDLKS